MDLGAYINKENKIIDNYIKKYYGEIPRNRGIQFMKLEEKVTAEDEEDTIFNKYVGQDVIYIHTRCGDCGFGYGDEDSNYVGCGAKEWEETHKDLFIEHITNSFDRTYCTHYFKAVIDDDYKKIVNEER